MVAMIWQEASMEELVRKIKQDYPHIAFNLGVGHYWLPGSREIAYDGTDAAGLLHELGHARLGHEAYASDIDLLKKEVAAWEEACSLAQRYGVSLNHEKIEDCLDTYRDWVYKRSICPVCSGTGVQKDQKSYFCLNCHEGWSVTQARFKRSYRLRK